MPKYLRKMTWKAGTSAFSLIGGLLESVLKGEEGGMSVDVVLKKG
jgi:hypothetical protein